MSKQLLPRKDTKAWNEVVKAYQTDDPALGEMAEYLGFANTASLVRQLRAHGVKKDTYDITLPVDDLEKKVFDIISRKAVTVNEISRQIDRSSETVIKILDSLRTKHFDVQLDTLSRLVELPKEPSKEFTPTEFKFFHNYYKIGLVSDTHLGSKYQQLTALYNLYHIFDDRDVDCIFHAGDLVDGVHLYPGHEQEIFLHNGEEQRKYAEEHYPKSKKEGLKTYIIGGQHDRSFYKSRGYNIVEHICEHRDDLVHRGFFSHQFEFKGLPVRLEHPGGGIAYARSYKPQKITENVLGFINTLPSAIKPVIMIFGHWHTPLHIPVYMGVDTVSLPCFQAQTPYMQQHNGMMPTVGGAIAEIWMNESNQLSSVKVEFIIMNDQIKEKDW